MAMDMVHMLLVQPQDLNYGWAKSAHIYAQKIALGGVSGGMNIGRGFDTISRLA